VHQDAPFDLIDDPHSGHTPRYRMPTIGNAEMVKAPLCHGLLTNPNRRGSGVILGVRDGQQHSGDALFSGDASGFSG